MRQFETPLVAEKVPVARDAIGYITGIFRTVAIIFFNQENNHNFFDKSIYLQVVFESLCFHGHV